MKGAKTIRVLAPLSRAYKQKQIETNECKAACDAVISLRVFIASFKNPGISNKRTKVCILD
ncbi:hypothetical protein AZ46_0216845 [Metabacillus indicus LMG 22858]|nr:hypothetical protein AZ46_0216845 [Metabacillus indicus LMG 22858]